MPTYNEPTKNNVTYDEPGSTGWFSAGWFTSGWFSGKGEPSYTEPSKESPNYTEPSKGS